MKTLFTALFILFAGSALAATIDVPRIDGVVQIPTANGFHRMEVDIHAPPAVCDAIAGDLNNRWRARELQDAMALGHAADYPLKTNIVCAHRTVTVPAIIIDEAVCDITLTETMTAQDVEAACPILSQ